jgi:hypothetical protein
MGLMASCSRCGAPLKAGAFACSICGLSAGAAPAAASETAAQAAAARKRRRRLAVLVSVVAVVAVVAVWSFLFRGPATSGDEFLGTWKSASMGSIGSATVSRSGDSFSVLLAATQSAQTASVPAHLDGKELVITPGDFSASGDAGAKRLGLALRFYAGDFRIALASVDPAHVLLKVSGTSPAGNSVNERNLLERAGPSPSPP